MSARVINPYNHLTIPFDLEQLDRIAQHIFTDEKFLDEYTKRVKCRFCESRIVEPIWHWLYIPHNKGCPAVKVLKENHTYEEMIADLVYLRMTHKRDAN